MTVFAVSLNSADERVWKTLQEKWPNGRGYILTDNMAFVAPDGIVTTQQISDAIGIGQHGGREVWGIVFVLDAYSGFNQSDLWEWLEKVKSA